MCISCRRQDKDMHSENLCLDCRKTISSKTRSHNLMAKYGITEEEYDALLKFQNGVCYICEKPPKKNGRRLGVDHDHSTMEIRGLLCTSCNLRIVAKVRDARIFQRAASYLSQPPATELFGGPRLANPLSNKTYRKKRQPRRKK